MYVAEVSHIVLYKESVSTLLIVPPIQRDRRNLVNPIKMIDKEIFFYKLIDVCRSISVIKVFDSKIFSYLFLFKLNKAFI